MLELQRQERQMMDEITQLEEQLKSLFSQMELQTNQIMKNRIQQKVGPLEMTLNQKREELAMLQARMQ